MDAPNGAKRTGRSAGYGRTKAAQWLTKRRVEFGVPYLGVRSMRMVMFGARGGAKGGADVALKYAWTLGAGCVVALCGCEGVAGIQDITLAPDATEVDDEDATFEPDVSSDTGADALGPDAGQMDGYAGATDVADTGVGRDAGQEGDAVSLADITADGAVDAASDVIGDQTTGVADGLPMDDGGGDDGDATVVDAVVANDAPRDVLALSDASDASVSKDAGGASDATVPIDAADGAVVVDAGVLQLALIDDQTGTNGVGWLDGKGLKGTWYSYADSLSTVVPLSSDAGAASLIATLARDGGPSPYAAHVSGTVGASQSSSAGMGFNLNNESAYDASAYNGFVFWGRIEGDASSTPVRFQVSSTNTKAYPFVYGDTVSFTSSWTQFVVRYSDLTPPAWYSGDAGTPTFSDPAALIACQFQLGENITYNIWVDDVSFLVSP